MVKVPARSILPILAFRDARCITHNPVNGTGGKGQAMQRHIRPCQVAESERRQFARHPVRIAGRRDRFVSPSQPDVNGLWRSSMSALFRALPVLSAWCRASWPCDPFVMERFSLAELSALGLSFAFLGIAGFDRIPRQER
jgi:hypothetical protein